MIDLFFNTINNCLPIVFIFTIIIISIRIAYLICNKKKLILHKEIVMLCFIIYILLLYYIVTFQDNNYGTNNFVLFKEIFRYSITSKLFFKNVIGNILLFIPLGFFTTGYIKNKTFIPTFILSFIISISIEFTQSLIGRTVDVDDILLNTIGGVLGYLIFKLSKRLSLKIPNFMKESIFLDIITLIIIIFIIYLLFKIEFWRYIV